MSTRINDQQKQRLVAIMETHHKFLFGRHPTGSGKISKKTKWEEITQELNSLGPKRNAQKWREASIQI